MDTQWQARYKRIGIQNGRWQLGILAVGWLFAGSIAGAASEVEQSHTQLLSGDRVQLGTVEDIRSGQARINMGQGQPRFVPMGVREDKGLSALKRGDLVEVTVNDQNLLVDVHLVGEGSHHRLIPGQLARPVDTGHERAVICTTGGKVESHLVRPVARSKVASMPVGADLVFLTDRMGTIVDVTFVSTEAVQRAAERSLQKSPLKGNLTQVAGVVLAALKDNTIVIRTDDGQEHVYEVRGFTQPRLRTVSTGETVVLLVDDEHKVADVAFVPNK